MSSATMMNHSRRQMQPPVLSNNKRSNNERDGILDGGVVKPSAITTKSLAKPSIHRPAAAAPSPSSAAAASSPALRTPQHQQQPGSNNKLLAGYLAHEYLSKGTLFGEAWEPPVGVPFSPPSSSSSSFATTSTSRAGGGGGGGEKRRGESRDKVKEGEKEKKQRYMEVAELLKGNGSYISGVVNPCQLARYLQLR